MVSILMPVYNSGLHLRECLDSILAQTETSWELIAVNDYSTDNSWRILQQYALRDSRIRPFQNQGEKGIIPALQAAFEHCRGSYISRMDADDLMPRQKLKRLKQQLLLHGPRYVATGKIRYFSEEGELGDGYQRYERWLNGLMDSGRHYEEIYRECILPSPCWMAYRETLIRCDAFNRSVYPEDYDLAFRFYEKNIQIAVAPECLHLWRDHAGRSSRTLMAYADPTFLELKLYYFLKIDHQPERPLVIWGAGTKGKESVKYLQQEGIPLHWVCNTPGKWGKDIYGLRMHNTEFIKLLSRPQVLVFVAAPDAQLQIRQQLLDWRMNPGKDFFFFC